MVEFLPKSGEKNDKIKKHKTQPAPTKEPTHPANHVCCGSHHHYLHDGSLYRAVLTP
jgi:hypothetical protein